MFDLASLHTDPHKEVAGVEVPLGPDSAVTIAAWQNDAFIEHLAQRMEPYQALQRINAVPEDISNEILWDTIAHTIVKGWRGISMNGKEVPFSVEAAKHHVTTNKRFRMWVVEQAQNLSLFRAEMQEQAEKNS